MSRLPDKPATRSELLGQLAANAATKPVNVAVPAGMAVAGVLVSQVWLIALAAVVYVVLATMTFFDAREAERVAAARRRSSRDARAGAALDAGITDAQIRRLLEAALREEQLLRGAIEDSDLALTDLSAEVDGLVRSLRAIAGRAQKLAGYLSSTDRAALARRRGELERTGGDRELLAALAAQAETLERMDGQLRGFQDQMEHATAVLATMRGQVVSMSVQAAGLAERRLSEQTRDLADQVAASANTMAELSAQAD
jgi:chromosome segregation ATPase